jgi:hypothetical protein
MKTEKSSFISKGLIAIVFSMIALVVNGQTLDTSIVKTRNLKNEDILFVESSIGDITVKTWDKNELRVEYTIYVEADSKKELAAFTRKFNQAVEDQIREESAGKVYAALPFKSLSINGSDVRMTFKDNNEKFELKKFKCSLLVNMPAVNSLNLKSNFNKVAIENLLGDATIEVNSTGFMMGNCKALNLKANFSKEMKIGNVVSAVVNINSCDLKAGKIESDLSLKSNFSHIEIEKIGNKAEIVLNSSSFEASDIKILDLKGNFIRTFKAANIDQAKISLNSSEFEASKINTADVERTTFSTIKITDAGEIKIGASSSSTFSIDNVNSIESESSSFSTFNINQLKSRFRTISRSGNVQIKNVLSGFEEIDIDGTFVDINMHIAETSNYLFSADLVFPNYNISGLNFDNHEKDMSHELIRGSKGKKELATSKVNLKCQSCKITVN